MARKKLKATRKGKLQSGLVDPLKKAHGGTVEFIGDLRDFKKKLPRALKGVWPNF